MRIGFQTMDYNETNATLDQVASEGNFADIVFSEFFLEGVATPILGIFGFFGNVLSIKVSNVIIITRNIVEWICLRHLSHFQIIYFWL